MGIYKMVRCGALNLQKRNTRSTRLARPELYVVKHFDFHAAYVFTRELKRQVVQKDVSLQRIPQSDVDPESLCQARQRLPCPLW